MTTSDSDRLLLQSRLNALSAWIELYCNDPINETVGAVKHIFESDMPDIRRIRWFSINSAAELATLWGRFIESKEIEDELHQSVFDFYILGISYVEMMAPAGPLEISTLYKHMARSITWPDRTHVQSNTMVDNKVTVEQCQDMLEKNPWVCFLIMLALLPVKVR